MQGVGLEAVYISSSRKHSEGSYRRYRVGMRSNRLVTDRFSMKSIFRVGHVKHPEFKMAANMVGALQHEIVHYVGNGNKRQWANFLRQLPDFDPVQITSDTTDIFRPRSTSGIRNGGLLAQNYAACM
jgi:hypothetical protein